MASGLEKALSELSLYNDSMRTILECPVCFEFCKTPIFMCSNGHHICNTCQPSMTHCPTCRVVGQPTARCLPLEKMADNVRTACANAAEGCQAVLNAEDMAKHWRTCQGEYMHECYVELTSDGKECCQWLGDRRALIAHVKQTHPGTYCDDDVRCLVHAGHLVQHTRLCTRRALLGFSLVLNKHEHSTYLFFVRWKERKRC